MAASSSTSTLHSSPIARIQKFIDQERNLHESIIDLKNQFWDILIAGKKFPELQSTLTIFQEEFNKATLRPRQFLILQQALGLVSKVKGKSPKEMILFQREILDLEQEMIEFEKTLASINEKIKGLKSQIHALRTTESKSSGKALPSSMVSGETKTGVATSRTPFFLGDKKEEDSIFAQLVHQCTSLKEKEQARQQLRIHARSSRQARRTLAARTLTGCTSVVSITHSSPQEQLVWLQEMLERDSEKCYDDEFDRFLWFPEIYNQLIPILLKKIEINSSDQPTLLFLEKIYLLKRMFNEALCQREKYLTVFYREAEANYQIVPKETTFDVDFQEQFNNWVLLKNANYGTINRFYDMFLLSLSDHRPISDRDWVTYQDVRNQSSHFDQTKYFELAFQVAGLLTRYVHEPIERWAFLGSQISDEHNHQASIREKAEQFKAILRAGPLHAILVELANTNAELFAFFEYSYIPEKYRAFFRRTLSLDPAKPHVKFSPHFYREVGPFVPRGQALLTGSSAVDLPKDVTGVIAQYESEDPVVSHLPLREASHLKNYYETLSKIIKEGLANLKAELDKKDSEPKSFVEGLNKKRDEAIAALTSDNAVLISLSHEIETITTVGLADEKKCGLLTKDKYIDLILSLKQVIDNVKETSAMSIELKEILMRCRIARYQLPSDYYENREEKDFSSGSSSSSTLKVIEGKPYFQYMIDVINSEVVHCTGKPGERYKGRKEKIENFLTQFSTEFESKEACTLGSTQDYQRVARLFTAIQPPTGELFLALNSHRPSMKGLFGNSDSYRRVQAGFQKLIDVGILPKPDAVLATTSKPQL